MFKQIIDDAKAAIQLKVSSFFATIVASLVFSLVLTYSLVRLIWYFETYLFTNYGTQFAVLLVGVIFLFTIAQILYVKYAFDRSIHEKREIERQHEKDAIENDLRTTIRFSPARIISHALMGFWIGLKEKPEKT